MSAVRVKICGVTVPGDADMAVRAGADAIGAVFSAGYAPSVDLAAGKAVFAEVPAFVSRVALFVDPDAEQVRRVVGEAFPDLLQFHGGESPEFCAGFGVPYLKACRVRGAKDIMATMERHSTARGLLLDGDGGRLPGGSGVAFDWALARLVPPGLRIIAGGLTPGNVAEAVGVCQPHGVDVSSGVSVDGDRRRKDPGKVRGFIENAHGRGT